MFSIGIILILILFVGLVLFLTGVSDIYHITQRYPWYFANQWYCADIDMTLEFVTDSERNLQGYPKGEMQFNGMRYDVGIGFHRGSRGVSLLTDANKDGIGEYIIEGTWRYDRANFVICVEEDYLFGGLYEELVFVPCYN